MSNFKDNSSLARLQQMGVKELSVSEQNNINGGGWITTIAVATTLPLPNGIGAVGYELVSSLFRSDCGACCRKSH